MKHTYWESKYNIDFHDLTKTTINGNEYELYFSKPEEYKSNSLLSKSQEIEIPVGNRTLKGQVYVQYDRNSVRIGLMNKSMDTKEDFESVIGRLSGFSYEMCSVKRSSYTEALKEFQKNMTAVIPALIERTENKNHKLPDNQSLKANVLHVPFRDTVKEVSFKFRKANGNGKEPQISEKSWVDWQWTAKSLIFTIPITTGVKADVCIEARYYKSAKCEGVSDPSHCDWVSGAEYRENMEKAIKRGAYSVKSNNYSTDMIFKAVYIGDTVITNKDDIYNVLGMSNVGFGKEDWLDCNSVQSSFTRLEGVYAKAHPKIVEHITEYKKKIAKAKRTEKKNDEEKELFEEYKKNREQFFKWLNANQ